MKEEMKENMVLLKIVREPPNPPGKLAQQVSNKSLMDVFVLRNLRIFPMFSIVYMIRIRIFVPRDLIQNEFSTEQYGPQQALSPRGPSNGLSGDFWSFGKRAFRIEALCAFGHEVQFARGCRIFHPLTRFLPDRPQSG